MLGFIQRNLLIILSLFHSVSLGATGCFLCLSTGIRFSLVLSAIVKIRIQTNYKVLISSSESPTLCVMLALRSFSEVVNSVEGSSGKGSNLPRCSCFQINPISWSPLINGMVPIIKATNPILKADMLLYTTLPSIAISPTQLTNIPQYHIAKYSTSVIV